MRLQYFRLISIGLLAVLTEQLYANDLRLADVVILDIADTAKAKQELSSEGESARTNGSVVSSSTIDIKDETSSPLNSAKPIKSTPIKTTTSTINKKNLTDQINSSKPKQFELHGRVNNKYVYLVVEKTKDNLVTGYLFDGKGKKKYIYGEWNNNTLQIYDTSKSKSTVTLEDGAKSIAEEPKPERASPIFEKNQSVIIKDSRIINSNISGQSSQKNQDSNNQPQAGLINIK